MKIEAKIRYEEKYLPTKRHRIPRVREVEETIEVELREMAKKDAPVAMIVSDYGSFVDEHGEKAFGVRDCSFLSVDNALYTEKRDMWGTLDKGACSFEMFLDELERNGDCHRAWSAAQRSRADMIRSIEAFLGKHVLIDGVIYQQAGEPRYVVQTFGLGHNHGGTGMFITQHYNPNISKDCYFTALQRDEAIAYANKVAAARGDTESVGRFGRRENIRVFIPEMVRCDPQREHTDGDPFLNSVEALIQGSDSALEAGLLVVSATTAEISDNKSSLDNQIQSASTRAAKSLPSDRSPVKESSPER